MARSAKILSGLLQDCENKSFNECIEKAKLLESFSANARDIRPECSQQTSYKVIENKGSKKVPATYVCIRCGQRAKHYVNDCYALNLKCNKCRKTGHLAKCCKSFAHSLHEVSEVTPGNATTTPVDVPMQHSGAQLYEQHEVGVADSSCESCQRNVNSFLQ